MNRKKLTFLGGFVVFLTIIVVFIYKNNFNKNNSLSEVKEKKIEPLSGLAIMLETKRGSGMYSPSSSELFPTTGYTFNETLSKCENGGTLSYDYSNQRVILNTRVSDKCYAYFDVAPPDVSVAVNNLPTTYGKLGTITCSNSDVIYNQQYNRIEISNINTKYENCTLDYTNRTLKVSFADYIMGLTGTTQGTGEVVNETANIPDYSSYVTISESSYTSQSVFSSSAAYSTSGTTVSGVYTFANNTWTSVPSAMTSNTYYHFKFNPSENGYYQMCYDLSSGNANNRLYAYVSSITKDFGSSSYLSASPSSATTGCMELGYVTTSDYIKVTQRAYTDISTLSFSIKKVAILNSMSAGIRYEGKNPNNYVRFNNEYWRIIGVFDSNSHGQSGKNLVKIIRADVLDGLAWHKSNTNDWTAASLNLLLNGAYYNAQDGTDSGYCYGYSTTATANCDYTKKGIQSSYRGMIANVTWYLGGYSSTFSPVESFYGYERGTTVVNERPPSTTGYIGLMYPSDYGYSVLSSSCARTTEVNSYYNETCAGQSWLYGKGYEWTLTPSSSNSNIVFSLLSRGGLGYTSNNARYGYSVRPVLYLDASVYKIDGDGSLKNPYIIGM